MRAQFVRDFAHDFAALGRGHHAPVEERVRCARDHQLVIGGAGHFHFGERLVGGGIERRQFRPGRVRDPVAITGAGIQRLDMKIFENLGNGARCGGHASF